MALIISRTGTWKLEIVKRSDAVGFEILPKHCIVECRRLVRDFERYAHATVAFVRVAMIHIMLRLLPRIVEAHELMRVQTFSPKLTINRINKGVVGWLAGSREVERDIALVRP
jgi:hypothetical protein